MYDKIKTISMTGVLKSALVYYKVADATSVIRSYIWYHK